MTIQEYIKVEIIDMCNYRQTQLLDSRDQQTQSIMQGRDNVDCVESALYRLTPQNGDSKMLVVEKGLI